MFIGSSKRFCEGLRILLLYRFQMSSKAITTFADTNNFMNEQCVARRTKINRDPTETKMRHGNVLATVVPILVPCHWIHAFQWQGRYLMLTKTTLQCLLFPASHTNDGNIFLPRNKAESTR